MPETPNHPLHLEPLHDAVVGETRPALQALAGAVAFLLLIACTNVANLLLSRSDAREREMAIRAAMGAPRRRMVRQLLTESVVLALAGGALGVAAAHAGVRALLRSSPGSLPRTGDVRLDATVLLASLAVSVVAGVLFGLAPALKLSGARFGILLKEGARRQSIGGAGARARRALIVAEMALAVALVVGSALMIRTVRTLLDGRHRLRGRAPHHLRALLTADQLSRSERSDDVLRAPASSRSSRRPASSRSAARAGCRRSAR